MKDLISGLIIAKNEEKLLPRVILSMREVITDIFVLVDSATTDNTIDVLHRHGCQFAKHPFANWRDQRNKAMELSAQVHPHPWRLWLDADEMLSPRLVLNLPTMINSLNSQQKVSIVGICRANFEDGKGPNGWPDVQPRITRSDVRWEGSPIHEAPHGVRIDMLDTYGGNIGHIIHDKTLERQKMQNRQYYLFDPSRYKTCPQGCEDIWKG